MPPKRKKIGRPVIHKNKSLKKNANCKVSTRIKQEDKTQATDVLLIKNEIFDESNKSVDDDDDIDCSESIDTPVLCPEAKKLAYYCEKCPKKFKFKKSYKHHLRNEHSDSPNSVACDQCTVRCPDKQTLKEHVNKFHERDIYECPGCNKTFVRRSHVIRHMAQSGCDGNSVVTYPCEICNSIFTRKDNLMVHLRIQHIHKESHSFSCKYCRFVTKNFSKLTAHWHKNHAETPNLYECNHCGKSTGSRAAMAKHLEIHGEKKFSCVVCGYSTFTVEVMRRHVLTHVDEKPYKCNLCNRSYIQRLQLQRHLEKHVGNVCGVCGEEFTTKTRLIAHQRAHKGLDKLHCPIKTCPYSKKEIANEASLDTHLKTHLGKKDYACDVCGKQFHLEVNMRRHLSTHTLDRPRRCMYCVAARAYVRGEQLVRHVRRHHAAIFRAHLQHVRQVLGSSVDVERVKKSELDSILNVLDAESERIMQGYSGSGVLYGGMQENEDESYKDEPGPLMTEEELVESLDKLLCKLIDEETLRCFGWPDVTVDVVLEKVIEKCGCRPADREMWTRMQRLRENTKHLFLYVIEDKTINDMLGKYTIDQIIKHILAQVSEDETITVEDS
ncbi:protein suppressor of hairy wing isoform X2 [Manduca sexta]|uniref:protein suppressor of hairy wing isoform X2 n=1 Tax=Manduca sexta TaxID=7130 RepID=UPI0018906A0D|nr:protein suppressor of hairy wing isoform X2 [Manduca sexta]